MALANLLTAIGLAALKVEARAIARRLGIRLAAGAIAGLLVLTGVSLGVAAFTVWLAGKIGTIEALLVVAAGMIVLAVIVQLVAKALLARRPSAPRPAATPSGAPPDSDTAPPGSALGSLAVVALVGFLMARQMFRR